jgi:hypothetical protein
MLSDLGSLQGMLQGLITISIGAVVSIKVFLLSIRSGHTAIIRGDNNTVQFITQNLYANYDYRLSFSFRFMLIAIIALCIVFTWLPSLLVVEALVLSIPLIPLAFLGITASPYGVASVCYFMAMLSISWFIWQNYASMDFVVKWAPALHPTWAEFASDPTISKALAYTGYFASVLMAIYGISWLVLLQMQTAFSFLINRGRFDDALKFSVVNAGISFLMILLAGGVLAAFLAPRLLWPDAQNGDSGYYVLWFVRMALYNTFWIEAFKP